MAYNPYEDSLETRVLAATPLELVTLLYDGAIDSVRAARRHLASGDIFARSKAITKAVSILLELSGSLNHQKGGEISPGLASLYDFMSRTLLQANYRQTEAGLITAEKLLVSVREAWARISSTGAGSVTNADLPKLPADLPWGAVAQYPAAERCWNA